MYLSLEVTHSFRAYPWRFSPSTLFSTCVCVCVFSMSVCVVSMNVCEGVFDAYTKMVCTCGSVCMFEVPVNKTDLA